MARQFKIALTICLMLTCIEACGPIKPAGTTIEATGLKATPSQLYTVTPSQTLMPLPTRTPSVTPYPPTPQFQPAPDIFRQSIGEKLFFNGDSNCLLPCWYGLRVGQSRVSEIQSAFSSALGLSDNYAFAMMADGGAEAFSHYVEGSWSLENKQDVSAPQSVIVRAYFDNKTDIVTMVNIFGSEFSQNPTTPQQIMRALGPPTNIWIGYYPAAEADVGTLSVSFDYPELGISIGETARVPAENTQETGTLLYKARWCLNGALDQVELSTGMFITAPFDPQYINLTDEQQYLFQSTKSEIANGTLMSVDKAFAVTPAELYMRATEENNACLTTGF